MGKLATSDRPNSPLAVIAVGYNRPESLKRLLTSVQQADYDEDRVDLVISLDNSGDDRCKRLADEFAWAHGNKRVYHAAKRLGLRQHIVSCGDRTDEYEAVVVLEDDLVVSPAFYRYAKAAVRHYSNFDKVTGISLYSHKINITTHTEFYPEEDGTATFMLQLAQSWGQVWTRRMWAGFRDWYSDGAVSVDSLPIPGRIKAWSEQSWMRLYNAYLSVSDTYFVYPYVSLTTNFIEVGQHAKTSSTAYQVPILSRIPSRFDFHGAFDQHVIYDMFFERQQQLQRAVARYVTGEMVTISLWGEKSTNSRFLLSSSILNYKVIASFGCLMRPIEANITNCIPGEDLFLYDTSSIERNSRSKMRHFSRAIRYGNRTLSLRQVVKLLPLWGLERVLASA